MGDVGATPVGSWRWLALFIGAVALALMVPFVIAAGKVDR
jgi:hypothetical protein